MYAYKWYCTLQRILSSAWPPIGVGNVRGKGGNTAWLIMLDYCIVVGFVKVLVTVTCITKPLTLCWYNIYIRQANEEYSKTVIYRTPLLRLFYHSWKWIPAIVKHTKTCWLHTIGTTSKKTLQKKKWKQWLVRSSCTRLRPLDSNLTPCWSSSIFCWYVHTIEASAL